MQELSDKQLLAIYAGLMTGARAIYYRTVAEIDLPKTITGDLVDACMKEMQARGYELW